MEQVAAGTRLRALFHKRNERPVLMMTIKRKEKTNIGVMAAKSMGSKTCW